MTYGDTRHVDIRILGPLVAAAGGRPVNLGGPCPQLLLAALLLDAGRAVPVERLTEAMWNEEPPRSARSQISIHVWALRKAFKEAGCTAEVIETVSGGYRVRSQAVRLDLEEVKRKVGLARETTGERAAGLLREALALWGGPVLAGLDSPIVAARARLIEELRLTAAEEWMDLELSRGRHRELIGELDVLVTEHPLNERLREGLMLALSRSGRYGEALEVYREGHRVLVEEHGLDPGRGLRDLYDTILLARAPAQLPPAAWAFTGRAAELELMDTLLGQRGRHLRMGVISGMAGVGKSALALHWAHRVADRFPDGQLFADLRGYDPDADPVPAALILARFLRALGIADELIPDGGEERALLFRSTLRERRVLIVLDNAASSAQVRALLPGSEGCCVIVTSRRRLQGLVAGMGACAVPLDVLPVSEAAQLVARIAGVTDDAAGTLRLAALCDGLPLGLRIAAARLVTRPEWTLGDLAVRLADDRLDQLGEVRAGFELSYRDLSSDAAHAFRKLAESPERISAQWLAGLLDTSASRTEELVDELVDAQLLRPSLRASYRLQGLVRLYAGERARAEEAIPV
ncbi:AfsR/SARP family transcriptional regulator [Streptosporangium sp. KLBMP 9127]|nr:winged helix-turn-helix domain-containing protein [Streptosporangium sp. KLBMP 9127]